MPAAMVAVAPGRGLEPAQAPRPLPPKLESYLATSVRRLTASQRRDLLAGVPVVALLDTNANQEVAIFGAVWVDGDPRVYLEQMTDIERFERGGAFRVTKRISEPPRPEDFALMDLPKDDVADLKNCRVSSCAIKLSQPSLDRLRKEIDWSKSTAMADAASLARQLAFEYVSGYREGGNAEDAAVGKGPMESIDRIAEATLFTHFLKQARGHATPEDRGENLGSIEAVGSTARGDRHVERERAQPSSDSSARIQLRSQAYSIIPAPQRHQA